jgi:hypothetical protein
MANQKMKKLTKEKKRLFFNVESSGRVTLKKI